MKNIVKKIIDFRNERGWEETDDFESIAKSIFIEAAELLENFQWDNDTDIDNVKDEIADILMYTIVLATDFGFDIEKIIDEKIIKNIAKYPKSKHY